jgi:hypothetical protein
MALTFDEFGNITTTAMLEARRAEKQRQRNLEDLHRGLISDAVKWRVLVDKIGIKKSRGAY